MLTRRRATTSNDPGDNWTSLGKKQPAALTGQGPRGLRPESDMMALAASSTAPLYATYLSQPLYRGWFAVGSSFTAAYPAFLLRRASDRHARLAKLTFVPLAGLAQSGQLTVVWRLEYGANCRARRTRRQCQRIRSV